MASIDELKQIPLFASLAPKELDYLARSVPDLHLVRGDYVVHEGDAPALFVVVDGQLEVTKMVDGEERVITTRKAGGLFGEPSVVLDIRVLASLRASEPSRVMRIEPRVFHTLAAADPEFSATVARSAQLRVQQLQTHASTPAPVSLHLIGPPWQAAIHALREFLHRNQIDFEWLAPDDPTVATLALGAAASTGRYPMALLADGTVLVEPTIQEVAKSVGLTIAPSRSAYDVVIIGGGPAGISAAVYGAAEGLRTLLIEQEAPGGQAGTSSRIENYLGFPVGVTGDELSTRGLRQARRLGAEIVVTRCVEQIDVASRTLTLDGGDTLQATAIIIATGVSWRRLEIEGLDRLTGSGIYYGAARTEAAAMEGRDIYLIGAGNSAGQAAVFFASYARTVTLVVRGESLEKSMSHYLIQQLRAQPNIRTELRSEVVGVHGGDHLEAIDIVDNATETTRRAEAAGLFVFIGADAATDWLPAEIARDPRGYVLTGTEAAATGRWSAARPPMLLETTVPGVFAAGDVRSGSVKRVASAVGDGGLTIAFAYQHIEQATRGSSLK